MWQEGRTAAVALQTDGQISPQTANKPTNKQRGGTRPPAAGGKLENGLVLCSYFRGGLEGTPPFRCSLIPDLIFIRALLVFCAVFFTSVICTAPVKPPHLPPKPYSNHFF